MIKQVRYDLWWVNVTSMWLEASEMSACFQPYLVVFRYIAVIITVPVILYCYDCVYCNSTTNCLGVKLEAVWFLCTIS